MNMNRRLRIVFWAAAGVIVLCPEAFAEGMNTGRKVWDTVMLFVNFGILVFLFIKYAKKPLMDFLHGAKGKIEEELNTVKDQYEIAQAAIDAENERISKLEKDIEAIQKAIVEMGQSEKAAIVDHARQSGERMINDAKTYAAHRIAEARKALGDEMVETAVSMVMEKMAGVLTETVNEQLVDRFLDDLSKAKDRLIKAGGSYSNKKIVDTFL